MVENIRENHPDSFIALAGISAGSGQVVSYIGREGSKTPIGAAASLCPAWDIREHQLHCEGFSVNFPLFGVHLAIVIVVYKFKLNSLAGVAWLPPPAFSVRNAGHGIKICPVIIFHSYKHLVSLVTSNNLLILWK